jgi:hypothetical protein
MPRVAITGWKRGCNTVAAIKELREQASIPLNEALAIVNRVLGNEQVVVSVSTADTAQVLADSLEKIGLIATSICD